MTTLYKISNTGAVQEWSAGVCVKNVIRIDWGLQGGLKQTQYEEITVNKSGRSLEEQMQLRINSRINKQLDKGYCRTIEEAKASVGQNAAKLIKPMLAQVYEPHYTKNSQLLFLQYKYNGHRCLVTRQNGRNIAYSRQGKPITTIGHIIERIKIPEGVTLDGELYIHGESIQNLTSLIKRSQPDNVRLRYVVYDTVDPQHYSARWEALNMYELGRFASLAETNPYQPEEIPGTKEGLKIFIEHAKKQGYEGYILRIDGQGYQPGVRARQLLKLKSWLDCEGEVVAITPSKDNWAVLTCKLPTGVLFDVSAPGTIEERTNVLRNKELYLGRQVTIEFAEWTKDGKPFHPVAIGWREDI